jgi:hypothetical protein
MHKFYFNDCLPLNCSKQQIISCLNDTLLEYQKLKTKYNNDIKGVISSKYANEIILNNAAQFSLWDSMNALPREMKKYAFTVFTKYPIESYSEISNEDDLIENNYYIEIGGTKHNAFHIKIAQENDGILFSLALHEQICKDDITIYDKDNVPFNILNLYGKNANTSYISRQIQGQNIDKADNWDKLLFMIDKNVHYGERFKKGFDKKSADIQKAIINHFSKAKQRNGITPFYADKNLIKDVTPNGEMEIKVYELRIFKPVAYRIYFYESESNNKIYLALMEKKPNRKVQNNHINTAHDIIKELVAISPIYQ